MDSVILSSVLGFDWDSGNALKNWEKHGVSQTESEELFFNQPLLIVNDLKHSENEARFYALGHTDNCRYLFAVFTVRKNKLRVISARDMSKKERTIYEKQIT